MPVEYRQRFEVSSIGFVLDATHLDGEKVLWDAFGDLRKYMDLLEYCKQQLAPARVTLSPASDSSTLPEPAELPPEILSTDAQPETATATTPTKAVAVADPASPAPVLVGAAVADEPNPSATNGRAHPLATSEPITQAQAQAQAQAQHPVLAIGSAPDQISDSISAFVSARGAVAPDAMIIAKELYSYYQTWCADTGQEPLTQRSFGMRLTDLGFERKRRGRGRHWWVGLGLTEG